MGNFVLCRYTYEIAPVYTTVERIVIEKMCSLVGYSEADGIFSPGNITVGKPNNLEIPIKDFWMQ